MGPLFLLLAAGSPFAFRRTRNPHHDCGGGFESGGGGD